MAIQGASYHQTNFQLSQAFGGKVIAGDATMEPIGFNGIYLLITQFPMPVISGGQEIEVALPGGGMTYEQSPVKTAVTGPITFSEVSSGAASQFLKDVINAGGYFDARIYEGTPDRHTRSYKMYKCFVNIDPADRNWDDRQQTLKLTGTFFGNYFGEVFAGNA